MKKSHRHSTHVLSERRRPLHKILSSLPDTLVDTGRPWVAAVSWVVVALALTGTQTYRAYVADQTSESTPLSHFAGAAHYNWEGFHRVAP